jgi:hypothetical protein
MQLVQLTRHRARLSRQIGRRRRRRRNRRIRCFCFVSVALASLSVRADAFRRGGTRASRRVSAIKREAGWRRGVRGVVRFSACVVVLLSTVFVVVFPRLRRLARLVADNFWERVLLNRMPDMDIWCSFADFVYKGPDSRRNVWCLVKPTFFQETFRRCVTMAPYSSRPQKRLPSTARTARNKVRTFSSAPLPF